ncbi:MAG: histidinol-phosphatase HisJ family protein [Anaerolineae bacterium]|nr:histidinol-phosphatase HisJ family protein [Anaerolineae bacterium]MDW8068539.1 histidinol-phosphatase HisJ family protein [Anaerolineae bacterium]
MIPDSHTHTCFSFDSDASPESMCRAALVRGMSEIAITDHVDLNPLDGGYGYFQSDEQWEALARCRARLDGRVRVHIGLECGEPHRFPQEVSALLSAHSYDVILGSIHWMGNHSVETAEFFEGRDIHEGIILYLEELACLAREGDYDVLAHPDIIRRAVFRRFGWTDLDWTPYEAPMRRVLRTVAERGKALEVNTSYRRRGMGPPGPSVQVLRWFREEGGQFITLGSDAHRPEEVGADFGEALTMVRAAGFESITVFRHRMPHRIPV